MHKSPRKAVLVRYTRSSPSSRAHHVYCKLREHDTTQHKRPSTAECASHPACCTYAAKLCKGIVCMVHRHRSSNVANPVRTIVNVKMKINKKTVSIKGSKTAGSCDILGVDVNVEPRTGENMNTHGTKYTAARNRCASREMLERAGSDAFCLPERRVDAKKPTWIRSTQK